MPTDLSLHFTCVAFVLRLAQPHAKASTVFIDEVDTRRLQSLPYFIARFGASAEWAVTRLQSLYCWNRYTGPAPAKSSLRPA